MIKFGTDGWRGEIARDFTFENVAYVALATAAYAKKAYGENPKIVIGYDTRFLSREFAAETARVLASQGVNVDLADNISSTPEVSFAAKARGADLGVVITASHNPPYYNGYKLKAGFGGPATPEQIDALEYELKPILEKRPLMQYLPLNDYIKNGKIKFFDAEKDYMDYIEKVLDLNVIRNAGFKVLFDPMHGAGITKGKKVLPDADEIHGEYNPSFGTLDHPEPIGETLGELIEIMKTRKYDIGLAFDGDADRLGAVDNEGNYVDSHRVFLILMKYLYEIKNKRGAVAKTVSLSSMVNKYCEKNNIKLHETAVGFKHIAKLMSEEDILIGGEESGGLSTIIHIPERDGLFNGLLLLEIMAVRKMSLKELSDELDVEFGIHRFMRRDQRVTQEIKDTILNACKNMPTKIGDYDVKSILTKDGYKFFVDGGWLLIRASGTEPLLRFYAEADSLEKVNELLDAGMKIGQ